MSAVPLERSNAGRVEGSAPFPVSPPIQPPAPSLSDWRQALSEYARPVVWRSVMQLSFNLLAYAGLMAAILWTVPRSFAASLILAVPAAGFAVRIFSIQHDCGHGSYFRSRRANDWVGRLVSPITLTPYRYWQLAHARHHGTVGHLDRQGIGDIDTTTVREYRAKSTVRRLMYRLYRHPLVLFGIAPAYLYYIRFRMPYDLPEPKKRAMKSILSTNLVLALIGIAIHYTIGLELFLTGFLPATTLGATVGVWLFFVHHNFEGTFRAREPEWRLADAQLKGGSHYALSRLLRAYTGNTGIHHVHHACPRIPNYRLPQCVDDHPAFRDLNRITLWQSFACAALALWDEEQSRMITFREERATRSIGDG